MKKIIIISLLPFFFCSLYVKGQENKLYQEKFAQANGTTLHYLDFGGSGLPIIFLQDFHDDAREWVDFSRKGFAPRFVKTNRVLAVTRRGWGKSANPGWGYDVTTQAEDIIGFMDALKIEKAVLVGRVPACMDMTYIAEHHPTRVAGLVYWNRPNVPHHANDSLLWEYGQVMARMACDVPALKVIPRNSWLPHFINSAPGSIHIPAMYFSYGVAIDSQSVESRFFEGGLMSAKQNPAFLCDSIAREYFVAVSKDPELENRIKNELKKADHSPQVLEAFKKAFTPGLKKVQFPETLLKEAQNDQDKFWIEKGSDFYYSHMQEFIKTLK